ncbi:MAG: 4Fe-4S binding protein [Ruminococcus sp.]
MIRIFYFSGTGHSKAVADYFADSLKAEIFDIEQDITINGAESDISIIVFPVYCGNIPKPVKSVLQKINSKYFVLIATYGRISTGNVLWESSKLVKGKIIAAAYVPTGHTYLDEPAGFDSEILKSVLKQIEHPKEVALKKERKGILPHIFPNLRSRLGVKILRTNDCIKCTMCEKNCPMQAISDGKTDKKCIRCLRCAKNCPRNALKVSYNPLLKKYLKNQVFQDANQSDTANAQGN